MEKSFEIQLILELSKQERQINSQIQELFDKVDWDKFLKLVLNQKIILIIEIKLNELYKEYPTINIPKEYLSKIRCVGRLFRNRLRLVNKEIEYLTQICRNSDIKVVIIKGMSMNRFYQKKEARYYDDIDILIDSQDFEIVHKILSDNQYKFNNSSELDFSEIVEASSQKLYSLGEYAKRVGGFTYKIDLHKSDCLDYYYLSEFYKSAIEDEGNYFFQIVDSFIFSSFHAWHHYPTAARIRVERSLATLKDYIDIRETYLFLKRNNLLMNLYNRIQELNCSEVVNNMLYVTERLFGSFCEYNSLITCEETILNDFIDIQMQSYLENRLFYPEIEKEKIKNYYVSKTRETSKTEFIECKHFDIYKYSGYDDESFWNKAIHYQSGDNVFFDLPYGTSIIKKRKPCFEFSLAWDKKCLIIYLKVQDSHPYWGDGDCYDPVQDSIKFIFHDDWSTVFNLQIKNDNKSIMFMDRIDSIVSKKLDDNIIKIHIEKEYYQLVTTIPWEYTDIVPKGKDILEFYFNFIIRNKELHSDDTIVFNDDKCRLICFEN